MTACEDPEFAALDTYIRAQLAAAAETYASHIDYDAKLKAVLDAVRGNRHDDTASTDG